MVQILGQQRWPFRFLSKLRVHARVWAGTGQREAKTQRSGDMSELRKSSGVLRAALPGWAWTKSEFQLVKQLHVAPHPIPDIHTHTHTHTHTRTRTVLSLTAAKDHRWQH